MDRDFPRIRRIRQRFDHQPRLGDVARAAARAVRDTRLRSRLQPGARVAVTVGSRGIAAIDHIVRGVVQAVREMGFNPCLIAAMGSHGGGTPEGQRALLAELEIDEPRLGCPILCAMDTVVVGTNSLGLPIHVAVDALNVDGVILLNRVKPHTSYSGDYESGLLKMLVVGLGKTAGAEQVHKLGLPGLRRLIPEVGATLLQRVPVVLGVAILENASERTARIEAVEPEILLAREPALLEEARGLMGRLPWNQLDVLIVGELGKVYSGTGLDPHVIGRQRVETMPDLPRPVITRLAVLDLAPESRGNAVGIGLADLTTRRFVQAIDPVPTRFNCYTSNFLARARVPIALDNDREVVAASLDTCWRTRRSEARMAIIPNTLELETIWATEPLLEEMTSMDHVLIDSNAEPLPFDAAGNLDQARLFPECLRRRRGRR